MNLNSGSTKNQNDLPPLTCLRSHECGGCAWIDQPYPIQRQQKVDHLTRCWSDAKIQSPIPKIQYRPLQSGGLRDRVDLVIESRLQFSEDLKSMVPTEWRCGLTKRQLDTMPVTIRPERSDGLIVDPIVDRSVAPIVNQMVNRIVDLPECPQLSAALQTFLTDFRKIQIPVERGSVRLRVSPSGERGVWLDFANIDIKRLLEERTSLEHLQEVAFVEIGQKRKSLIEKDGQLKLGEPTLQPWFETYIEDDMGGPEVAVPLFTCIGSFTQPGFVANKALIHETLSFLKVSAQSVPNKLRVIEFGSGAGNFTLPLASICASIDAYEVDELACEGLRQGARKAGLGERIRIHQGNWHFANNKADFSNVDAIVADPPRSGLKNFLNPLTDLVAADRPAFFIYISCYADSFALDLKTLEGLDYVAEKVTIIDQFPQSPHFEIVSLLRQR